MQIEITQNAMDYLARKSVLYSGKNRYPRIVLATQSCRGAEFRLFFDFPHDGDEQLSAGGYNFLVATELIQKYGGFKLDTQSFFFNTTVLIEPYNDIKECKCKTAKEET
ncbi:MAG: hypothetical protein U1C33_07305 [Candidatus Cloacimonadaceae bacterium]|nr:hypothetical protein [Candidatus Cloacimonadaceae bacterium]